jgi:adenylate cyclase
MGELWTKVTTADEDTTMEIRIPANRGIVGYVASTGQALNIPDAYKDPRFDPTTDRKTGYVTRNILCLPVFNSANELIGVTQLINKQQGSFTASDEEFMRAFNIQAGIALENAQLFENVLLEKQYQKDILQSLSDAVISTDMEGRVVTINDAAMELLGCPLGEAHGRNYKSLWSENLIGRLVWEIVPIENLQMRLQDSLRTGAKHYVPEQTLTVGRYTKETEGDSICILAVSDRSAPDVFIPWNQPLTPQSELLSSSKIQKIVRSTNLTVNPLTNPEGGVRGGVVVLSDISQEKRMKATMYRYLSPRVAEQVMALGEDGLMEGERKEVTVLFSDIRGYTTLTENLGAQEVVSLLNQYFETMVEAVFNHEGTLDKFIGDALMGVFGAPLTLKENHAWKAVQAALEMRQRLQEFNQCRVIQEQPQIQIGIGISSGEVVAGNIGSHKRMDYTVIGDGVNLSSRLEGVTKEYGCDIIISEYTYQLCRDRIWVRQLDKIRVKGKNQAVTIYELIGDRQTRLDSRTEEFLFHYHAGRAAYLSRNFPQALLCFQAAQQIQPTDPVVNIYIQRTENYQKTPPPQSWDGVWNMLLK